MAVSFTATGRQAHIHPSTKTSTLKHTCNHHPQCCIFLAVLIGVICCDVEQSPPVAVGVVAAKHQEQGLGHRGAVLRDHESLERLAGYSRG
eukprot:6173733-Pleurochrysis_carterae.AAC.1